MKKANQILSKLMVILICCSVFTSCMTTKTQVGTYREQQGETYVYSKGKQIWILWGIFPVGRTSVNTPSDGNCEVVTKIKFVDGLIYALTGGIVSTQTIKVNAKRQKNNE